MFLQILIAILLGCFAGIFTGVIPGVHINLVAAILLSLSPILAYFAHPISLGAFIVAMAITHTFIDFVPSVYLGAPESATALAVLPGHRMLLEGKGYEAIKLSTIGALFCLLAAVIVLPLLVFVTPWIYGSLQSVMGWALLLVVGFMILRERGMNKKAWSFFVFLISGVLGLIVFNIPTLNEPLLPMLSGIFGTSMLVTSLYEKVKIPKQNITDDTKIEKKHFFKSIVSGTFSGSIVSIFPGMGPAQAAILGSQIAGELGTYGFIILVGGIGTVSMLMSLITLFSISKARNGAIIVVEEMLGKFGINELVVMIAVALIAAGIAVFLSLNIAKIFSKIITKVDYKKVCIGVIAFVSLLVFYFSGWIGGLVLITATAIGLIPSFTNIGRNHGMGCLLLPVILYFVL